MRKRILLIHHGTGVGGGLIALLGLIDSLKNNFDITVFCIFDSNAKEYIQNRNVLVISPQNKFFYKYIYKILSHSSASYFNPLKYLFKYIKLVLFYLNKNFFSVKEMKILSDNYDILYLNSTFISDWAFYPKKIGKKIIIHVREPLCNDDSFFYRTIRSNIEKYSNKIIAITKDNAERLNLDFKTIVIYDSIVHNRNNVCKDKESILKLDNDYKYFTYLGGSSQIKGFEQMVKSLDFVEGKIKVFFLGHYNTKIESIGQLMKSIFDPYIIKSIFLYKQLQRSDKSIIIGKSDDVFLYINNSLATISCFSKPHASLPILESFSSNTPVIVSDVKGMDEFVKQDYNGYVFKNGNPRYLAIKMMELASLSDEKIKKLRDASEKTFNEIMNSSSSVEKELENL